VAESIPALGNALPFAGRRGNGGLGRLMSTAGTSSPPREEPMTSRGALRSSPEKGNHHPRRPAAAGGGTGRSLCSELLGPCSPALFSNGHRRKRWSGRGVARKRRVDRGVAFGVSPSGDACSIARSAPEGLSRFAALVILLREGKVACPKKHARARSPSTSSVNRGTARSAKAGGSGVCPCVG